MLTRPNLDRGLSEEEIFSVGSNVFINTEGIFFGWSLNAHANSQGWFGPINADNLSANNFSANSIVVNTINITTILEANIANANILEANVGIFNDIFVNTTINIIGDDPDVRIDNTGYFVGNSSVNAVVNSSGFFEDGVKIEVTDTNPGGSNTHVQYNDSGVFGGSAGFAFNETTNTIHIGNTTANTTINSSTISVGSNTTINTSVVEANNIAATTFLSVGNSTVNTTMNSSFIETNNVTANNLAANNITANNVDAEGIWEVIATINVTSAANVWNTPLTKIYSAFDITVNAVRWDEAVSDPRLFANLSIDGGSSFLSTNAAMAVYRDSNVTDPVFATDDPRLLNGLLVTTTHFDNHGRGEYVLTGAQKISYKVISICGNGTATRFAQFFGAYSGVSSNVNYIRLTTSHNIDRGSFVIMGLISK